MKKLTLKVVVTVDDGQEEDLKQELQETADNYNVVDEPATAEVTETEDLPDASED